MGNKFSRRRSQIDDRFTRPQGLYQHKDIDFKRLRRSIIDAKLAPCYAGAEDAANDLEECPICFLHYPSLNRSKCCTKEICTECFLQVKVPNAARPVQCPFCKTPNYAVDYKGAKTQEEKGFEQAEEQKVIEAKIRIRRQQEIEDQEARLQRQEQPTQEESPPLGDVGQEQNRDSVPAAPTSFPVFSGSAYTDGRPVEQHPAPESWNTWPNVDSTAIGYPQPDFFTFHPSRSDSESPWHRGSQREFGRQNPLSSSSALSDRNLSSFNSRRRGAISGEAGQGPGAAYPSYNREEDFDLDLEDIMVMEAIWLSIQEQGAQRGLENSSGTALSSPFGGGLQYEIQEVPSLTPVESSEVRGGRRGSVTGGFASAIAALAERQVAGTTTSEEQQISESDSESTHSAGDVQAGSHSVEEQIETVSGTDTVMAGISEDAGKAGHAPNVEVAETAAAAARAGSVNNNPQSNNISIRNMNDCSSEAAGDGLGATSDTLAEQGLNSAEAGTSFCSSEPSGSAAAAAAAVDSAGSRQVLPESFEEQMMLAMALSLAEAQAQAKCCKA